MENIANTSRKERDFNQNPYLRLMTILHVLEEIDDGISISELSEMMQVNPHTIAKDIAIIKKHMYLTSFDEEYEEEEDEDKWLKDALSGKNYDAKIEKADQRSPMQGKYGKVMVELSEFEYFLVKDFFEKDEKIGSSTKGNEIRIKSNYVSNDAALFEKLNIISEGIKKQQSLVIVNKFGIRRVIPCKVVRHVVEGKYYLMYVEDEIVQYILLNEIRTIKLAEQKINFNQKVAKKIEAEIESLKYRWGMGTLEPVTEVEVRIENEARLPIRIQKELQGRMYAQYEECEDGALIYKDKVIDLLAFKKWIIKYGKSVKVLKPKKLADEIKKDAKDRVMLYNNILKETTAESS